LAVCLGVRSAFTKGAGATPMSRLGSAWVMRRRLEQARALVHAQDAWCTAPGAHQRSTPFPQEREHESLAALLRGEVKLNTHCYLVQDFESQSMAIHSQQHSRGPSGHIAER